MYLRVRGVPSFNALRAFEAAARLGGFVAAAEDLSVTPAAISHQIKGLEEFLNVTLFDRIGRRVVLTEAGKKILPELQQGFNLIERAIAKLDEDSCLLTVSANPAFAAKWLLPRIHLFNQQYPDIDIRIDASTADKNFDKEGIDLAIRFGSGNYKGMVSIPLLNPHTEEIFPVCSADLLQGKHPLKEPSDLRFHTLLHDETLTQHHLVPDWEGWLADSGLQDVDAGRGLRFNSPIMALEAAINGQGVALSCAFIAADDLAAGRLVRPFVIPCQLDASYHIVYPQHKRSTNIELFCQWLMEMCGNTRE